MPTPQLLPSIEPHISSPNHPIRQKTRFDHLRSQLPGSFILLLAFCMTRWWNQPCGYAILICLLCNLSTGRWVSMLREHRKNSHRRFILAASIPYPWFMAFNIVHHAPYKHEACSLDNILLHALMFSCGYISIVTIATLIWERRTSACGRNPLHTIGTTLLAFIYPCWLLSFMLTDIIPADAHDNDHLILPVILATAICQPFFASLGDYLVGEKIVKPSPFRSGIKTRRTCEGFILSLFLTTTLFYYLPWIYGGTAIDPGQLVFAFSGICVLAAVNHFGQSTAGMVKQTLIGQSSRRHTPVSEQLFELSGGISFIAPLLYILFAVVCTFLNFGPHQHH